MYGVELYAAVRLAVVDEGLRHHEASRRFGIDRRTVKKMLSYSAPPAYRRRKRVRRPKLDGFTGIIDAILEAARDPDVPRKQRHTAHRIFERLRDEYGFTGGYTIVTSNLPFQEWTTVFASECLTGALLDRITHHVHILEMNADSYRLKQSRSRRQHPSE